MMKRSRTAVLAVGVVLVVWAVFWSSESSSISPAFAQQDFDSGAPSAGAKFYCPAIIDVSVWENRIHFRCNVVNGSIHFYAYSTDALHIGKANQMLAIGHSAFVQGKGVYFHYETDSNLNPPGCLARDCRGLVGLVVQL